MERHLGSESTVDFLQKLKIAVVVEGDLIENVVKVIADAARTGDIGDRKILISSDDDVMMILRVIEAAQFSRTKANVLCNSKLMQNILQSR